MRKVTPYVGFVSAIVTGVLAIMLQTQKNDVPVIPNPTVTVTNTLPECVTEDSATNCYWDAAKRGNGKGKSFVVYNGGVYLYDSPANR
jgi:hypothetical protein